MPLTALRDARPDESTPLSVAAAEGPTTTVARGGDEDGEDALDAALADRIATFDGDGGRASRSAGWARRALEELELAESTSTTVAPTTTVVVRRATPTTTAAPRPATTAAPRPSTTTTTAPPQTSSTPAPAGNSESGKASWYDEAPPGTCAHKTIAKGTIVTVHHEGKSVSCEVADRGPYVNGWIIDLSKDTFSQLAPLSEGVIAVTITW